MLHSAVGQVGHAYSQSSLLSLLTRFRDKGMLLSSVEPSLSASSSVSFAGGGFSFEAAGFGFNLSYSACPC